MFQKFDEDCERRGDVVSSHEFRGTVADTLAAADEKLCVIAKRIHMTRRHALFFRLPVNRIDRPQCNVESVGCRMTSPRRLLLKVQFHSRVVGHGAVGRRYDVDYLQGDDGFAVLLPGVDYGAAEVALEEIDKVLRINNQFYADASISISAGIAICDKGEPIQSAVRRADAEMYRQKREFYTLQKKTSSDG
ncbi:diguanylate cyclase domain-containing protein [Martelella mangrovi]|uniref:GGDEF domain-containing protein n=1 Tax=Martelella mangrovi TaxID=1397477 RepID=A0ABV2ICR0_9HYPH